MMKLLCIVSMVVIMIDQVQVQALIHVTDTTVTVLRSLILSTPTPRSTNANFRPTLLTQP